MKKFLLLIATVLVAFQTSAQTLVFKTNFNNGQANDVSGNGHHGVLSGNPVACPGYGGTANTALYFDGIDDKVTIPADSDFNLTTWTMQALIKPTTFYPGQCQVTTIIWHGLQFTNEHFSLRICDNWYDNFNCGLNSTSEAFDAQAGGSSSTPDFQSPWYNTHGFATEDEWYCLSATYDGASIKVYVDGELVESDNWQGQYNYTGTQPTYLGWSPHVGYPYWFTGVMDEVSIWNGVSAGGEAIPYCDTTYSTTSLGELERVSNKLVVFPTPANEQVQVEVAEDQIGGQITILNGLGQVVESQLIVKSLIVVNIQDLPAGIYIVRAVKDNKVAIARFVKN